MEDSVYYDPQHERRENWYSEADAAQDRRDKMTFSGTDSPDLPPLAWVTYWRGEESNLFGAYVPRNFRRWGYVLWDAPRLEASGGLKYMELEPRPCGWDARDIYRDEDSDA